MIKTLIFDLGSVFINLDYSYVQLHYSKLFNEVLQNNRFKTHNNAYEKGLISIRSFIAFYLKEFPGLSKLQFIELWNSILSIFPEQRFQFIKDLAAKKRYKLILLSNTNTLHINWIIQNVPFYNEFKMCFNRFYLSHQIHQRKPDISCFELCLKENSLKAKECFFIDDTLANIKTAQTLGIKTWHYNPVKDNLTILSNKL